MHVFSLLSRLPGLTKKELDTFGLRLVQIAQIIRNFSTDKVDRMLGCNSVARVVSHEVCWNHVQRDDVILTPVRVFFVFLHRLTSKL